MGVKHKKTRKEKIIADYRHQVYTLNNKDVTPNSPATTIAISENPYANIHILRDVLKTGILSLCIVAAQIILFFLLKRHVITLPFVNY